MHSDHEINRAAWDQLAVAHGQDSYYDADALCAGASSLIEEEEDTIKALGSSIAGKHVLHLQCHLGFDAITFARQGARVTGLDFSTVSLEKARVLAQRCGVTVDWVCADAMEPPEFLYGKFDLVWATIGVLCWIADISAWMRALAGMLVPGGKLVLIDGYPDADGSHSSSGRSVPPVAVPRRRVIEAGWDYATSTRTGPQVQFRHTLDAVSAAARSAGLRITRLAIHTATSDDLCISGLTRESDGRYRRRVDGEPQPLLFSLIAERRHPVVCG